MESWRKALTGPLPTSLIRASSKHSVPKDETSRLLEASAERPAAPSHHLSGQPRGSKRQRLKSDMYRLLSRQAQSNWFLVLGSEHSLRLSTNVHFPPSCGMITGSGIFLCPTDRLKPGSLCQCRFIFVTIYSSMNILNRQSIHTSKPVWGHTNNNTPTHLSIDPAIYRWIYLSVNLPTCLPTDPPTHPPTHLPACLPAHLPTYLPTYLPT